MATYDSAVVCEIAACAPEANGAWKVVEPACAGLKGQTSLWR